MLMLMSKPMLRVWAVAHCGDAGLQPGVCAMRAAARWGLSEASLASCVISEGWLAQLSGML